MLLPAALFVLITVGLVVPCLIDVARTPWYAFGRPAKATWLVLVAGLWAVGALAWLIAGHRRRGWTAPLPGDSWPGGARRLSLGEARLRHPAWRAADPDADFGAEPAAAETGSVLPAIPVGPDDDPEFLDELQRRISGPDGWA